MKKIDIYLVRHAETESRSELLYPEASNISLSKEGEHHSRVLARYFKHIPIMSLLVSPYPRAHQTAAITFPTITQKIDARLIEYSAIKTEGGAEYKLWKSKTFADFSLVPPSGESMQMASLRVHASLIEALKEHDTGALVVVGHALAFGAFLKVYCNLSYFPTLDNASVTHILWNGTDFQCCTLNQQTLDSTLYLKKVFRRIKHFCHLD